MRSFRIQKIQLETITPVSIGNGEVLSPYVDFVFEEDRIYVVDKDKIAAAIPDALMDEYIENILGSFQNNRSNFNLKAFLEHEDKLDLSIDEYAKRSVVYSGLSERDRREVKCTVKNIDQPYIPGSTLKGALKGAILYNWLLDETKKKESNTKGKFDELMHQTLKAFEKVRGDIEHLDRMAARRRVSYEDRKEMRRIKGQIRRKIGTDLARDCDRIFSDLLTKNYLYSPRAFSQFKVSDSQPLYENQLLFQLANRLHYKKGEVSIPINLEAIAPYSTTTFDLVLSDTFQHEGLQFLNEESAFTTLFKQLNKFHKDNLDLELDMLDQHDWYDHVENRELAVFDRYQGFLEKMYNSLDELEQQEQPKEAYLCIGFGKSFFYNSIGMLVYDWNESKSQLSEEDYPLFKKYCKLFFLGRDGQRDFPVTRTVTQRGLPMGWVKLKI
jgi:CRISPR type III-A-associated RAMP protein Csm5